jgi:hypothetical protein
MGGGGVCCWGGGGGRGGHCTDVVRLGELRALTNTRLTINACYCYCLLPMTAAGM